MGKARQKSTSALLTQLPPPLLAAAQPRGQPEGPAPPWEQPRQLHPSDQPSTANPIPGCPPSDRHHQGKTSSTCLLRLGDASLPTALPAPQGRAAQPQPPAAPRTDKPTRKAQVKSARFFPWESRQRSETSLFLTRVGWVEKGVGVGGKRDTEDLQPHVGLFCCLSFVEEYLVILVTTL